MTAAAVAAGLAAALPAAAAAHVTLQPKQAVAGSYTVESVRVPNERDNASTTKVEVQLPSGFKSVSYEPVTGWKAKATTQGGEVRLVTFTAVSPAAAIKPGQFRDFPLSVQIPDAPGQTLTFKALQTYSDGEVVRWIGAPDADDPAPQVAVVAAAEGGGHGAAPAADGDDDDNDDGSNTLSIIAIIVGGLGLLAGGAALASARRA
jgi:uncharacterized protein